MVSLLDDHFTKKPHLRLKGGVWSCRALCWPSGHGRYPAIFRIGYGYTWREAWNDWKRQEANYA